MGSLPVVEGAKRGTKCGEARAHVRQSSSLSGLTYPHIGQVIHSYSGVIHKTTYYFIKICSPSE
jgi:hypothetical protein